MQKVSNYQIKSIRKISPEICKKKLTFCNICFKNIFCVLFVAKSLKNVKSSVLYLQYEKCQ